MAPRTGTGERYATEVVELWTGLARTLAHVEALAEEPDRLEEDELLERLRRLQYALHLASEQAYGLAPPAGAEAAHSELAAAVVGARDATADVAAAVDRFGMDGALRSVYQWRGALFRVRLARLRLTGPSRPATPAEPAAPEFPRDALAAVVLACGGAALFVAGALAELWPLWAAGMLALAASFLVYKP